MHPMYGVAMIDFRPVECGSGKPITPLTPGYVSKQLYSDMVGVGWGW